MMNCEIKQDDDDDESVVKDYTNKSVPKNEEKQLEEKTGGDGCDTDDKTFARKRLRMMDYGIKKDDEIVDDKSVNIMCHIKLEEDDEYKYVPENEGELFKEDPEEDGSDIYDNDQIFTKKRLRTRYPEKNYEIYNHDIPISKRNFYDCQKCTKSFVSKKGLLIHFRAHQAIRNFTCVLCKATFDTNTLLVKHKSTHENEKRSFKCKPCRLTFSDHCDFLLHNLIHCTNRNKCVECNKSFYKKKLYRVHIPTHYDKRLKCNLCDKSFKSEIYLKVHHKGHVNPYECGECGKLCNDKYYYYYHMSSHTGVKPFQCLYCGKGFASNNERKVHTRIHTGYRPYECNMCGMKFRLSAVLNRHKATHDKEKKYECDICKKKFKHLKSIRNHKRHHVDYMPYSCDICKERFSTFYNLTRHTKRRHTVEKPHKCELCGVAFVFKNDFLRHERSRQHKNAMYREFMKKYNQ